MVNRAKKREDETFSLGNFHVDLTNGSCIVSPVSQSLLSTALPGYARSDMPSISNLVQKLHEGDSRSIKSGHSNDSFSMANEVITISKLVTQTHRPVVQNSSISSTTYTTSSSSSSTTTSTGRISRMKVMSL